MGNAMITIDKIIANYQDILINTARMFSSVFEILLSYVLANNFFSSKIKNKNRDFLPFLGLAAGIIFFQEKNILTGHLKYIVECVALVIVLFVFYNGTLKNKFIGSAVFSLLVAVSVVISSLLLVLLSNEFEKINELSPPFANLLKLTLSNVLMVIFAVLIGIFAKKSPHAQAGFRLWLALFSVPAITLITFSVFQYYIENYPTDSQIIIFIYASGAGLIFINFLVFILFMRLQNQLQVKRDNDMLSYQLKLQENSVNRLETSYNRTRAFRHDIKNHITLMSMLAENEKYDELKSYIKDMSGILDESSYVKISGISAVDAILNEKMYEAQAKNITTSYDVINLDKSNIRPIDICIILSNALDNAIEANCKTENADDRYIKLKIHGNETFSVISVSNPTADIPKKLRDNEYRTSKSDNENHGFGLKSINTTVKKYKGEMLCKCEEGVFTIVIRLNSPVEKKE